MADYQWKPLTDEKKFEDLVNDLCSAKYGLEFQIYGRKGQKQHGIDGYAWMDENKFMLHQCKNKLTTRTDSVILNELLNDLEKETLSMIKEFVENKKYKVEKFIFANSFKRDTLLQNKANELSRQYGVQILIWSWDEISDMLELYSSVANKYYDKNKDAQRTEVKNYIEKIDNNGGIINIYQGQSDKYPTILYQEDLKERYREVNELKKAIFSYYSSYGTNSGSFRRATTFDELFDILQTEKECLYCILKEMGNEVDDPTIDCEKLKLKSESSKEINKIIVRIDSITNNLNDCQISGYIGFSSESFDAIENSNEALDFTKSNHSQILSDYIDSILHGRSCARIIELQLLLPNQLFKLNFEIKDKRIRIIKRLLFRIENHEQLEEDEIRFWKRNSDFYHSYKSQKICKDSICSLDENELSDFREDEKIDKHICVISDECLSHSVQDIYNYGITIVLYPYDNSCTIINTIDFKNQSIQNIKNMIFKFMKKNQKTHFIYDDYNDLDFLKHESKVEGTDDDYL